MASTAAPAIAATAATVLPTRPMKSAAIITAMKMNWATGARRPRACCVPRPHRGDGNKTQHEEPAQAARVWQQAPVRVVQERDQAAEEGDRSEAAPGFRWFGDHERHHGRG